MDKLTISIVNYNGGEYIQRCLKSIEDLDDNIKFEVVVVDNASSDESLKKIKTNFPKVKVIENIKNIGFGKAHNQVLKNSSSEYLLILNPDVEIKSGVIEKLVDFLKKNQKVGAISPKIVLSSGRIDLTAHRGFPSPWASFLYYFLKNDSLYHLTKMNMNEVHEVDSISGAFFLTRKDVLERSGYFDEEYFMYGEDIDLCFRIKEAGFKVMYDPEVEVVHHKGISSGLKKDSQTKTTADLETKKRSLDAFYEAMLIFYDKHYAKHNWFVLNWLVYLGINAKWLLAKRKLQV